MFGCQVLRAKYALSIQIRLASSIQIRIQILSVEHTITHMKSLASSIQIRVSYVVEVVLYRMCSRAYKYAFCTSRALSIDIVLYRMCSVYKYAFRTLRACNSIEHTNSHGGSCDVSSYRWSVFLFFPCSLIINIKKFFFRRSSVEDGG